jgi:hypothetical protein
MSAAENKAVFLTYASQHAEAGENPRRESICRVSKGTLFETTW